MAAVSAVGSSAESSAQGAQLEAQAVTQEYQADEIVREASNQAERIRASKDQIIGSTVSSAAGSGVEVSTGSVLDLIGENAFNVEMDAMITEQNAQRQARELRRSAEFTRANKPSGVSSLLSGFGGGMSGYASGLQLAG